MAYNIKGDLNVARDLSVSRNLTVEATAKFSRVFVSSNGSFYYLPTSAGSDGQLLITDGAGQLFWGSAASAPEVIIWRSSAFSVTNGQQFGGTHSIGQDPDLVYFELTNISAESGYSPGDKVQINYVAVGGGEWGEDSYGITVRYNSSTVSAVVGSDGIILNNFSTGVAEVIDNSNWTIQAVVTKFGTAAPVSGGEFFAGDGLSLSANTFSVDNTVVRTTTFNSLGDPRYAQLSAPNTFTGNITILNDSPTLQLLETDVSSRAITRLDGGSYRISNTNGDGSIIYSEGRFDNLGNIEFYKGTVAVASIGDQGTVVNTFNTVITKEKGDARYAQLSADNTLSGIINFTAASTRFNRTNDTFNSVPGTIILNNGACWHEVNSAETLSVNRRVNDGTVVGIYQAGTLEGSISVAGTTVSFNSFAGSHWSQLSDNSKPTILRGTVMETIDKMCEWPEEDNDQLPKVKISDTPASSSVYGVFLGWDEDDLLNNDMYVVGLGAHLVRINEKVAVQRGDLLESNGDGTARVQSDNIIKSSTIGKVTANIVRETFSDGSYLVPAVLYCG